MCGVRVLGVFLWTFFLWATCVTMGKVLNGVEVQSPCKLFDFQCFCI